MRKVRGISRLLINQMFGEVVICQWWMLSAFQGRHTIRSFAHEGEEGIQAGDAPGIAPLQAARFVQSLYAEQVGPERGAMQKDHKPHTRQRELSAHCSHGILPGQGVRRRTDDQFLISDSISRVGSRVHGVLEVIPDRHSESLPESGPMFNGAVSKQPCGIALIITARQG
jgi:hypothetical protein